MQLISATGAHKHKPALTAQLLMACYGNSELVTYPEMPGLILLCQLVGFLARLSALFLSCPPDHSMSHLPRFLAQHIL